MRSIHHRAVVGLGILLLAAATAAPAATTTNVPLGGNAFVTKPSATADEVITDTGLHNWDSADAVTSVYVDVTQAGDLNLALVGALNGASHSTVEVSVGSQTRRVMLTSTGTSPFAVGNFRVTTPGYVKVDLKGLSTDGGYYGDISDLRISGSATGAGTVFANDPSNFYFSRRGPSVHLGFNVPASTEYFYSEITVPTGQDPIGTYYMANGFSAGYMGMQVNSATERRVLFSIFDGSDGQHAKLIRKGPNVVAQDFDGEGTGGQSYLVFPWQAGQTYRFIVRAQPGSTNTVFTGWFGTPDGSWRLIASWNYPSGATYLKGVYSFLECFDPDTGYIGRSANYGNEWARTTAGQWTEQTVANFTTDATGDAKQRLDYAGGSSGKLFYLKNDGFFANSTASGQNFSRTAGGVAPKVDLSTLP